LVPELKRGKKWAESGRCIIIGIILKLVNAKVSMKIVSIAVLHSF
jgi:hypothetical protein